MLVHASEAMRREISVTDRERGQERNYEIRVRGHLGTTVLRAFPALRTQRQGGDTLLRGHLPDRAAMYGLIATLEALGLELVELRRLPS
jgi:hypothetical protein